MDKLTFNLDKINHDNIRGLHPADLNNIFKTKLYATASDFEKILKSSFKTNSSELREFIEKTFGISFVIGTNHYSHHRNQLNKIIKNHKITQTRKGQRSSISFNEYKNIITSDEFIKFINSNLEKDNKVDNQKKMYEELMYLQVNKYNQTELYREENYIKNNALAFALNLVNDLVTDIKSCYILHLNYPNESYKKLDLSIEALTLLEITSYRFNQKNIRVYSFDSQHDVISTNNEQLTRFFLEDVDRWNNNFTNGELS